MAFSKGSRFDLNAVKVTCDNALALTGRTQRPASRVTNDKQTGDERYASLLKRIKDLECVHADDKQRHQAEIAQLTRTNADRTEQLDTLQKQHDALNKARADDQREMRALRTKLRACEDARDQLAAGNGDTQKALARAETLHREDVEMRDRTLAELTQALVTEKKKREMLEACLDDVRKSAEEDAAKLRADATRLQRRLNATQKDDEEVRRAAEAARDEAEDREEELLAHLERCRTALGRVAEEYARLASSTVTAKAHVDLKEKYLALQSRSLRLERKLANSESQVTELAYLIRQKEEEKTLLLDQLRAAEEEIHSRLQQQIGLEQTGDRDDDLTGMQEEIAALGLDIARGYDLPALVECHSAAHDFYRGLADDMRLRVDALESTALHEQSAKRALMEEMAGHVANREASSLELERLQTELAVANRNLANEQLSLAELGRSRDALQDKANALEKQLGEQASQHKAALQKERDMAQKLTMQLRMSKTAEDTLKGEVAQLNSELADASRFQDAYYKLMDETEGLVARNDLAEGEVARLSRFNAEILGHNNPAQRIAYVDRIRKELADAKQKLLACIRERDALIASSDELRHEIELYKSSVVPIDSKPRSLFIRVSRPPLTNQSLNGRSSSPTKHMISEHLPGPGDMTLDELM